MKHSGMTLIVRSVARLVTGFICVFGVYTAVTGHVGPGGGFSGGVILAIGGLLLVLAFGRHGSLSLFTEGRCRVAGAVGALGFVLVALSGYAQGGFFVNGLPHEWETGGTILLSDLAVLLNVAAGLFGAFLALSAFRRRPREV